MSHVLVIDTNKNPCNPVHPAAARTLLSSGQAAVWRRFPFTIILKAAHAAEPQPLRVKIDPGSKTTGIAVVNDTTGKVVWAAELTYRGQQIRDALLTRRAVRRNRRQRKTRYRQPRFLNRRRAVGWLAPSLHHRVLTTLTWVERLRRWAPLGAVSMELVRFDTQLMQNADITGILYQQGTLTGYEVREYLLEKWNRRCAYCGVTDVPLEVEHLTPKSRGGSDRVSNLVIACHACNQRKGQQTATEFGFPQLQAQAKQPLTDAAVVNSTRWALYEHLLATGLPVEVDTGGRTKYNRTRRSLPKTHWLDAVCVGKSTPDHVLLQGIRPLLIRATGHGSRQMCRMDRFGFPRTSAKGDRRVHGFKTGDIARAIVTTGTKVGTYVGRIAVRSSGRFNITTHLGVIQGLNYRFFQAIHRGDGYSYMEGTIYFAEL